MTALLLASLLAYADVVGPEPENCPKGSTPVAAHEGNYCTPVDSCAQLDCAEGTCKETRLCVVEHEGTDQLGDPFTWREATGACTDQSDCSEGTCEAVAYCDAGGCGCSAGLLTAGLPALLLPLALLGRRRRR